MVKVSHEVPLILLEQSLKFNHYDYCLPHLLDKETQYKDFFYKSKESGRYIIMDNSLHELGTAYNTERLLYWVNELKPNEFIVPDVWENKTQSVVNAREWAQIELPKETTKVAVVQAIGIHEAAECYQTYKDLGYKKIAFSYGASYYSRIFPHPDTTYGKAFGRLLVISKLFDLGIIHKNDRIHLLGCNLPQEFGWYKNMPFIESIDTSNPIMAAVDGISYKGFGLTSKPLSKIDEVMNHNHVNEDLVLFNVAEFKQINLL